MGFEKYPFQPCMFYWRDGEKMTILLLYVDDILVATKCDKKLREIEEELTANFEVTDLGEPKKFLGLEAVRNNEKNIIWLHQEKFTNSISRRFDMLNDKGRLRKTPMKSCDAERKGDKSTKDERKCDAPYRQAIGSLVYLANGTRPDIMYAVNVLSRKQSCPTNEDWELV